MQKSPAVAATVCLLLSFTVWGQSSNATVSGAVTDASGAFMPGVTVTAKNAQTGIVTTASSNSAGIYNFPVLQPGTYSLSTNQSGFLTQTLRDVVLGNTQHRIDFTLLTPSVGGSAEESKQANDRTSLSSSSISDVVSETMVRKLPMVGNDVLSLLRMLPGVTSDDDLDSGVSLLSFAGIGQIGINTTRDGLSVSDGRFNMGAYATTVLNPEFVAEMRLVLSPVDAELGRGNSQVQIQTKSGTNRFSGSAVWNIRNSALNGNTWSNNSNVDPLTNTWQPIAPDWYNNHQYTVSYGGPIVKNKTFFFALWDQQVNLQRNLVTAAVMTDTARQGIFRYFEGWNPGNALSPTVNGNNGVTPSVDLAGNPLAPRSNSDGSVPYTGRLRCFSVFGNVKFDGTPFTDGDCKGGTASTTPAPWDSRRPGADPTGYIRRILDKMPPANYFGAGDGLNRAAFRWVQHRHGNQNPDVTTGLDQFTDRKQFNLRIDENFSASHRLNLSWSYERNDTESDPTTWPGGLNYALKRYPQVFTANFVSVLPLQLLNEARFGMRRQDAGETAPWESDRFREEAMNYMIAGSNGYSALISPGVGAYSFGGSANGVLNTSPGHLGNTSPFYSYADTVSWTAGQHAFRLGTELRFARTNAYNNAPILPFPRVMGGAGGNPAPLGNPIPGIPNLLQLSRMQVSNMLYFLAGSVNNASMLYWIDDPGDVTQGRWEDAQTKGRKYRDQRWREWSVFWKDDWKVTHDLTLNLGLRYDYFGAPYISTGFTTTTLDQGMGLLGAFRTTEGDPFKRWLRPGNVFLSGYGPNASAADALKCIAPDCDPNLLTKIEFVGPNSPNPGKRVLTADRNNFGPAVGFAWRLPWLGEGKTTVRGGYQITYGGSFGAIGSSATSLFSTEAFIGNAPGSVSPATANPASLSGQYLDLRSIPQLVPVSPTNPIVPGRQLDPFASTAPVDFFAFDSSYVTPYVQNFNVSITRELGSKVSLDLRYIGTVSRKQAGRIDLNTTNVYHNKELFDALETTRAGGAAQLFDQMFAGLNLNNGVSGYAPVGTLNANGVLQTGSAHMRRNAVFAPLLANGNYAQLAVQLGGNGPPAPAVGANGGLLALPQGLTGVSGRLLRNGCDRIAAGQTLVGSANPTPLRCFPENYIRANPQLGGAILHTNSSFSNYHSMQTQFVVRPARGFTYVGTYTWSKNLGVPGLVVFNAGTVAREYYTDPSDRRADYTFTNAHHTHDLRGSANFDLPLGPDRFLFSNSSGWLAKLTEGWRTSVIFTSTSGMRANLDSSTADNFFPTGLYGNSVPDVVRRWPSFLRGQVEWDQGTSAYFGNPTPYFSVSDPQCAAVTTADNLRSACTLSAIAEAYIGDIVLQNPKPGTRGTFGQRRFELPGIWNFDANLAKTFFVSASGWIKSVQLRVDATNVLNHPRPGFLDLNINSPTFGYIFGKGDQVRTFQGQVRLQL